MKWTHIFSITLLVCGSAKAFEQQSDHCAATAISQNEFGDRSLSDLATEIRTAATGTKSLFDQWREYSSKLRLISGSYTHHQINHTFGIDKVSEVKFRIESPVRWRWDWQGTQVRRGGMSTIRDKKTGEPYSLESGLTESWIVTEDFLIVLHPHEKTAHKERIPANSEDPCPLPIRLFTDADGCEHQFELKMIGERKEALLISAVPKIEAAQPSPWTFDVLKLLTTTNCKEAAFLLDRTTARPKAVRWMDPSGQEEIYRIRTIVYKSIDDDTPVEVEPIFNEQMLDGYTVTSFDDSEKTGSTKAIER